MATNFTDLCIDNAFPRNCKASINEEQAFITLRNTLVKVKRGKEILRRSNIRLRTRFSKLSCYFNALGNQCNIKELSKHILHGQNDVLEDMNNYIKTVTNSGHEVTNNGHEHVTAEAMMGEVDSRISNEGLSMEGGAVENIVISIENEDDNNVIECAGGANSNDKDTLIKEDLLKRKLKQLAKADVVKSRKIRELNSVIVAKNNVISELNKEIAEYYQANASENN